MFCRCMLWLKVIAQNSSKFAIFTFSNIWSVKQTIMTSLINTSKILANMFTTFLQLVVKKLWKIKKYLFLRVTLPLRKSADISTEVLCDLEILHKCVEAMHIGKIWSSNFLLFQSYWKISLTRVPENQRGKQSILSSFMIKKKVFCAYRHLHKDNKRKYLNPTCTEGPIGPLP